MKDTVKYGLVTAIIYAAFFTLFFGVGALVRHKNALNFMLGLYTRTFPLIVLLVTSAIAFRVGYRERKKYNEEVVSKRTTMEALEYAQLKRTYLRQDLAIRKLRTWGIAFLCVSSSVFFDPDGSNTYYIQVITTCVVGAVILGLIMRQLKKT